MSFILSIDTAVVGASVCLSNDEKIIGLKQNSAQGESAAWIHTAIQELLQQAALSLHQLSAVAVSSGPGSYTGLRIGLATAKGLCYVLKIPLFLINTLQMMATAATGEKTELLCPMIDARRMEVFTAIYAKNKKELLPPQALILQPDSFALWLQSNTITFFGNGSSKFQPIFQHPNAVFKEIAVDASHVAILAYDDFRQHNFANLAYSEPYYGKAFFSPPPKL